MRLDIFWNNQQLIEVVAEELNVTKTVALNLILQKTKVRFITKKEEVTIKKEDFNGTKLDV